jgi:hypothetical protein
MVLFIFLYIMIMFFFIFNKKSIIEKKDKKTRDYLFDQVIIKYTWHQDVLMCFLSLYITIWMLYIYKMTISHYSEQTVI